MGAVTSRVSVMRCWVGGGWGCNIAGISHEVCWGGGGCNIAGISRGHTREGRH